MYVRERACMWESRGVAPSLTLFVATFCAKARTMQSLTTVSIYSQFLNLSELVSTTE